MLTLFVSIRKPKDRVEEIENNRGLINKTR